MATTRRGTNDTGLAVAVRLPVATALPSESCQSLRKTIISGTLSNNSFELSRVVAATEKITACRHCYRLDL